MNIFCDSVDLSDLTFLSFAIDEFGMREVGVIGSGACLILFGWSGGWSNDKKGGEGCNGLDTAKQ